MAALSIEQVLTDEAAAIHGETQRLAFADLQVRATAQLAQPRRSHKDADTRSGKDEDPREVEHRKAFYRALNQLNRAALCCSGGGIRSATFCLGVIQALAIHSLNPPPSSATSSQGPDDTAEKANQALLSRFHYLSTVSGGGYIGSWLSSWRARDDFPTIWRNLTGRPDGPDVEPPEISWLRAYSNYLTPKIGVSSVDSWTDVAIYLRNLLLNWLVIVPAVALALLLLKLVATFSVAVARAGDLWAPHFVIALIGIAFLIVAQAFTTSHRETRRKLPGTAPFAEAGNVDQNTFLCRDLLWSVLSAIALTSFLTSQTGAEFARGMSTYWAILLGAFFGVAIYAGGWLAGRPLSWDCKDFGSWAVSGSVYGALLGLGAHLFTLLCPYIASTPSIWRILFPVILGVPWVLVSQLLAETIFVGLVSYEPNSDADREWLGRDAGWIVAAAIVWMLTTFLVFAGGYFFIEVTNSLKPYIAAAGGVSGIGAALIGKSAKTPAQLSVSDQDFKANVLNIALVVTSLIFAAILVVGISVALDLLLLGGSLIEDLTKGTPSAEYITLWLVVGLVVATVVAGIASCSVNINRFSLHALYRNRLVRAYLGASRQRRRPDNFTGFDDEDNLPVHTLWPPKASANGNSFSLFHIVNITLNVVQSKRLAWQERKAESFTVSPLHCGAAYKGFRSSKEYGGSKTLGISLGTAMAISGAAVSPNMGYHSSPTVTLLLALFNVRLGWWLGNPGDEGEKTYKDEGPAPAIVPLFQETFGLTTDDRPYVYLSDGGHFENLGLYEMVRRRCRFIVTVDAGCDPGYAFADLGNAVRKIFIDLGIRITFSGLDKLKNRPTADETCQANNEIPYHVIGMINYREADGTDCEDGLILYIKPAYHGTEGAGVRSYATAHPAFPHESTADQWFTEAQFESYRSLGLDIVNNILRGGEEEIEHGTLGEILAGLTPTTRP